MNAAGEHEGGFTSETIGPGTLRMHAGELTVSDALEAVRTDGEFLDALRGRLADAPFEAFFWELPALTRATLARPFEFVLVDAKSLAHMPPEPEVFAEHFVEHPTEHSTGRDERESAVSFWNLGGDALLVAPRPAPACDPSIYAHLAVFTRRAPAEEQRALWRAIGRAASARLSDAPLWISTSGLGVAWLHVRFDQRPKYYQHTPYRALP